MFGSFKGMTILSAMNHFSMARKLLHVVFLKVSRRKMLGHFNHGAEKVDRRMERESTPSDFMSIVLKHGLRDVNTNEKAVEDQSSLSRAELYANFSMSAMFLRP